MDKNAFLPHKWKLRLNRGLNNASIKRRFFFRRVLDRHILSLADQQLITGFALVLAGHIKFTSEIQGAHFSLIVYLGCLSSSPHLAGVITVGNRPRFGCLLAGVSLAGRAGRRQWGDGASPPKQGVHQKYIDVLSLHRQSLQNKQCFHNPVYAYLSAARNNHPAKILH
jgi:hypothetical protein